MTKLLLSLLFLAPCGCASPRLRAQECASERLNACIASVIHSHYIPSDDEQFLIRSCQDVYRMETGK